MSRTIYTLTQPAEGYPELSGRLMYVRVSKKSNELGFYDAISGEYITHSAPIIREQRRELGNSHTRMLYDADGTLYSLMKLEDLLPTKLVKEEPLTVLATEKIFKHINYGDGYNGMKYKFNKKIDNATFIKFIEDELGRKLRPESAWYLDYDMIEAAHYTGPSYQYYQDREYEGCVDNIWIYKEIRRYTD